MTEKYYAVCNPEGHVLIGTISSEEEWAINQHCPTASWHGYVEIGYTVSEITITKVNEDE